MVQKIIGFIGKLKRDIEQRRLPGIKEWESYVQNGEHRKIYQLIEQ